MSWSKWAARGSKPKRIFAAKHAEVNLVTIVGLPFANTCLSPHVKAGVRYDGRLGVSLTDRMIEQDFPPDDELFQMVEKSHAAAHALAMKVHGRRWRAARMKLPLHGKLGAEARPALARRFAIAPGGRMKPHSLGPTPCCLLALMLAAVIRRRARVQPSQACLAPVGRGDDCDFCHWPGRD